MKEAHPSYGMLSISRVHHGGISGINGTALFGSSIKHRDTICIELKHAEVDRQLNRDWYHGNGIITTVEMSQAQFAEMITSMNVEPGVPCTIRFTEADGHMPECPYESKVELHKEEYKEHLEQTYQKSVELTQQVRELFTKKTLNKKDREEILNKLLMIQYDLVSNQEFQLSQFQEQIEKTIQEAKGEIESFYQNRLGIPEIESGDMPLYIEEGNADD